MSGRVLIARPASAWARPLTATVGTVGQLVLGLLVVVIRVIRVAVDLSAVTLIRTEAKLAAATGRPAISQTVVGAIAGAFVTEFRTAYTHTTARREA
jgi:hypothetical protein